MVSGNRNKCYETGINMELRSG